MKKIGIFCVGTGGHVLPAKNIILQLNKEGVSLDEFIVVTDKRGAQYLEDLNYNAIYKYEESDALFPSKHLPPPVFFYIILCYKQKIKST